MDPALERLLDYAVAVGLQPTAQHRVRLAAGAEWLARASAASGLSQYRDPGEALIHAMGPALTYFSSENTPRTGLLADVGAGNGAIGATIALFAPEMQIHLVDRARRAYTASELLVARLGVGNATAVLADLTQLDRQYDAVVFRALAPAINALPLAEGLVVSGGLIGAYHRRGDEGFERPSGDLTVLGTMPTLVPALVLTCYRR